MPSEKSGLFIALFLASLIALLYSRYLISFEAKRIAKPLIYYSLCFHEKDDSKFFLQNPTSIGFCSKINKMQKIDLECKDVYDDAEEIEACENLKALFEDRQADCINLLFGEINTTLGKYSIEKDCAKLLSAIK